MKGGPTCCWSLTGKKDKFNYEVTGYILWYVFLRETPPCGCSFGDVVLAQTWPVVWAKPTTLWTSSRNVSRLPKSTSVRLWISAVNSHLVHNIHVEAQLVESRKTTYIKNEIHADVYITCDRNHWLGQCSTYMVSVWRIKLGLSQHLRAIFNSDI